MKNIAIIGAGISGVTAATVLKDHANVTLFEKSRGVGGRMSTRRDEPHFFDHGAQYFTVSTDEFKEFISPMMVKGIIARWDARFVEFENNKLMSRRQWDESYPHYVGVPGMNAVVKYLSQDLNVHLGVCVRPVKRHHDQWHLEDDQGNVLGVYDWVISTTPAEQAADLLPSYHPFNPKVRAIKMRGCFSLMLGFSTALPLAFDAALVRGSDISWISVNSSKPGRSDTFSLLIHSTNDWADAHTYDTHDRVMEHLCDQTTQVIGFEAREASRKALHQWRFANIDKQTGSTHFFDIQEKIVICGDWFIQGRVEAGFISGYDAATKVLNSLKSGG